MLARSISADAYVFSGECQREECAGGSAVTMTQAQLGMERGSARATSFLHPILWPSLKPLAFGSGPPRGRTLFAESRLIDWIADFIRSRACFLRLNEHSAKDIISRCLRSSTPRAARASSPFLLFSTQLSGTCECGVGIARPDVTRQTDRRSNAPTSPKAAAFYI